ncbi:uncharacterized protein LOC117334405 isoform X2 [Pecten maximus]|uniref:uncharacterized protein LOC117334405 isoform X2 n=1 Tax=Pecten maximus TaxID=6579 RepID=UPI001458E975|nr:uncharacterized protein LOC117334405 isoform X2 [Pecten maximus]
MKTDLNDIKRSIASVHSDVKQKYQRRCSWSHCVDKHARKLSPNGTCKSSLTSTDEENVLPMDNSSMSPDMLSDKDSGLFTDDCFTNSNRSNRYPLYGSVKSRINHNCKPRLRRFYVQEKPGLQDERHSRDTHNLCRHSRDTHELCHRKKESSVLSDDGFLESTFRHQWTPKTKRKPDHSKSKTKISGHLDDLPRGSSLQEYSSLSLQDYGIGMVPRGSVKVLKPRQLVTEKRHRLGRVNSTENETQHYRVLESTDKGRNNGISRDRFPHQIRTQYKTQIDERQGNNIIFSQGHPRQHAMEIDVVQDDTDISSQGHYQQHTIKIDKRLDNTDISSQGHSQQHTMQIKESQRYNGISCQGHPQQHAMQIGKRQVNDGISSQGHPQQHTMGIGKRQDNTDISCQGQSQQQLRNTEHRKNYEDKSLDDLLLLEKTISEMEQRGELDLETDGIDNPNLTELKSTIRNDEAKEREKERAENVKTEQLQTVATEKAEKGREHGYNSSTNRHSDAVSEGRRSKGQELTDFAENDDDMEYSMETSDNVSTMTSEATGSSFESGYSFLPNVDTKAMLQSVGLDTDGILVRVLNQNKQCIEDSSHEAKGNGIDTVLLLDASSSIDDKSFGQMKSACLNIVEFIETLAAEKGIEENVALVVFGGNPMILQHLTIDYRKLYDKIENIDPGGSSPMCIGTLLCMLELHLRGGATSISKYQIPPRVIMMTDGRPTDDNRFRQKEVEFGVKSPTVKENVLLAMDEMRHHGYEGGFCSSWTGNQQSIFS